MSSGWGSLLAEVTALAAVVALSPVSVIPAIGLVVHSERPRPVGLAFVAGWLAGKATITVIFVQVPRLVHGLNGTAPPWTAWARIAAAILLLAAAVRYWRLPRRDIEDPGWLDRVKRITPLGAAGVGVALTVLNPKVLLACAAAGYAIGSAQLGATGAAIAVVYFTAIAGSSAAVPILAYSVWSHRVDRYLNGIRNWMQRHQVVLTVAVLALIGVALLYSGVDALLTQPTGAQEQLAK